MRRFFRAMIALFVVVVQVVPAFPVYAQEFQDPDQGGFILPDFYIENILIDFSDNEAQIIIAFQDHDQAHNESFSQDKLLTIQTGWQNRDEQGALQGQRYVDMHTLRLDTGTAEPLGDNRWLVTDRRDFANYDIYGANAYIATIARIDHGVHAQGGLLVGEEFNRNNSQVIYLGEAQDEYLRSLLGEEESQEEPTIIRPDAFVESYSYDEQDESLRVVIGVDQPLPEGVQLAYSSWFTDSRGRGTNMYQIQNVAQHQSFTALGDNRWELVQYDEFSHLFSGERDSFTAMVSLTTDLAQWQVSDPRSANDYIRLSAQDLLQSPQGEPESAQEFIQGQAQVTPLFVASLAQAASARLADNVQASLFARPDLQVARITPDRAQGVVRIAITSDVPLPADAQIDYQSYTLDSQGQISNLQQVPNGVLQRAQSISDTEWELVEPFDFSAADQRNISAYHVGIQYRPPAALAQLTDPNQSNDFLQVQVSELLGRANGVFVLAQDAGVLQAELLQPEDAEPVVDLDLNHVRATLDGTALQFSYRITNIGDVTVPYGTPMTVRIEWVQAAQGQPAAQGIVLDSFVLEPQPVTPVHLHPFSQNNELGLEEGFRADFYGEVSAQINQAMQLGATHARLLVNLADDSGEFVDARSQNNSLTIPLVTDYSIDHNDDPWIEYGGDTLYFPSFSINSTAGAGVIADFNDEGLWVASPQVAIAGFDRYGVRDRTRRTVFFTPQAIGNEASTLTFVPQNQAPNMAVPFSDRQTSVELSLVVNGSTPLRDANLENNTKQYSVASDLTFSHVEFVGDDMVFYVRNQRPSVHIEDYTTVATVFTYLDQQGQVLLRESKDSDLHFMGNEGLSTFTYTFDQSDIPAQTAVVQFTIDPQNYTHDLWPRDNSGEFRYDPLYEEALPDIALWQIERVGDFAGDAVLDASYNLRLYNPNPLVDIEGNVIVSMNVQAQSADGQTTISRPVTVMASLIDGGRNAQGLQEWQAVYTPPADDLRNLPNRSYTLILDPENRYQESDETNNQFTGQLNQFAQVVAQDNQEQNAPAQAQDQGESLQVEHEVLKQERERREQIALLPGDALYPIKTFARQARRFFTFDKDKKVALDVDVAEQKVQEVIALAERNNSAVSEEQVESLLRDMSVLEQRVMELPDEEKSHAGRVLLDSALMAYEFTSGTSQTLADDVSTFALRQLTQIPDTDSQMVAAEDTFKRLVPATNVTQRLALATQIDQAVRQETKAKIQDTVVQYVVVALDKSATSEENTTLEEVIQAQESQDTPAVSKALFYQKIAEKTVNKQAKEVANEQKASSLDQLKDDKESLNELLIELESYDKTDVRELTEQLAKQRPEMAASLEEQPKTTYTEQPDDLLGDDIKEDTPQQDTSDSASGEDIQEPEEATSNPVDDTTTSQNDEQKDVIDDEPEKDVSCDIGTALVCAENGVTYDNACQALDAKVRVLYEGSCNAVDFQEDTCPDVREPVCGVDGTTYKNKCYAERLQVDIESEGECVVKDTCPTTQEPVCDITGVTHRNSCVADQVGLPYTPGACGSTGGLF